MKVEDVHFEGSYSDIWESFFRHYQSLESDAAALARREKGEINARPGIYYMEEIEKLFVNRKETLYVSFEHVNDAISLGLKLGQQSIQDSARGLHAVIEAILYNPDRARLAAAVAAHKILEQMHYDYAQEIIKTFRVEFTQIGIHYEITEINHTLIDQLISIEGFVTKVDDVQEGLVTESEWRCMDNHATVVDGDEKPRACTLCNKSHLIENELARKMNTCQEFELMQRYDKVSAGRMATPIPVRLLGRDAVHSVKGGDFVRVNGIVRARKIPTGKNAKSSRYQFYIESSSLSQKNDDMFLNIFQHKTAFLEDQVKRAIRPEAEEEDYTKCVQSIAPSVFGHGVVKEAIFLQMIGSKAITMRDGNKHRGDINIFLCGDPSTGKSALARAAMPIYRRSVYVNGQQTTKVGLTASITQKDNIARLEAGAYLMGRGGIVVIDEFQLLDTQAKGALLEVMEDSQDISIMKGGTKTSVPFRADCATLALANPLEGKWDRTKNVYQNTGLRPENISRFDSIFIFTDTPDEQSDAAKAEHWFKNLSNGVAQEDYESGGDEYIRSIQETENEGRIHTVQFMAYLVRFIKKEIVPNVQWDWEDPIIIKLKEYYLRMRKINVKLFVDTKEDERIGREQEKHPAIGMRQLASLVRYACASAAAHFRTFLTEDDCAVAIKIMDLSIAYAFTGENTGELKGKAGSRSLAARLSLSDLDILRRAEQQYKVQMRDMRKKYFKFQQLIKKYGFRFCSDCFQTGWRTAGDGSNFLCQICNGRGGSKVEMSINDITAECQTMGWHPREISNAIEDFKKVRAIVQSPRNAMYIQLFEDFTAATIKTVGWIDLVVGMKEEEQQYNYAKEEAMQSPNGAPLTTAYDLATQEVDLTEEYEKADPVVMEQYEQVLSQVEEVEKGEEDESEVPPEEEEQA